MKSISPGGSSKDYCRESSKDVPVSRLVSVSDLCLQSWASLMQNLTGIRCFTPGAVPVTGRRRGRRRRLRRRRRRRRLPALPSGL